MADKQYSADNPFAPQGAASYSEGNPFAAGLEEEPETLPLSALAGESFLNSLMAAPGAAVELFGRTAAGMGGPAGEMLYEQSPMAAFAESIPRPTVGELGAGARALSGDEGTFDERFGQEMAEQDVIRQNTYRESPIAAPAAELGGDALALLTGRMPFANKISKFEDALMTVNKPDIFFSTANLAKAPTTIRRAVWDGLTQSQSVRSLIRGTGRSVEAGLEATALDMVNGEDPGETFGYAAGLQAANSAALSGMQSIFKGGAAPAVVKLAAAGYVGAQLWNLLQIATPIDDNFLAALNASNEKVLFGLLVGTAAGLAGGGRIRSSTDDVSRAYQTLADGVATLPRGTVQGMIREMRDAEPEGQQATMALLQATYQNPDAFTDKERARINAALENGSLVDTATVMMNDNRFVKRIMQMPEQEEPEAAGFRLPALPYEIGMR